jgi:vacuolar-type H+-ATPase subunit H
MEILQLVDQLEQVLNRGWRVPFTASLVVNEEECLRLIDQMRISVPSAIKESERMIGERDRIMEEARTRAESILDQAEEDAMRMVSQHFVVQEARREAEHIVNLGEQEAMRLIQEAEDYALTVLRELVEKLGSSLRQAENGIQAIEESRTEALSTQPQATNLSSALSPSPLAAPVSQPETPEPVNPKADADATEAKE